MSRIGERCWKSRIYSWCERTVLIGRNGVKKYIVQWAPEIQEDWRLEGRWKQYGKGRSKLIMKGGNWDKEERSKSKCIDMGKKITSSKFIPGMDVFYLLKESWPSSSAGGTQLYRTTSANLEHNNSALGGSDFNRPIFRTQMIFVTWK